MATKLFEDENQVTFMGDDGNPMTVAKGPFGGQVPFGQAEPQPETDQTSILTAPPTVPSHPPEPLAAPPSGFQGAPPPPEVLAPPEPEPIFEEPEALPEPDPISQGEIADAVVAGDPRKIVARGNVAMARSADVASAQLEEGYDQAQRQQEFIQAERESVQAEREKEIAKRSQAIERAQAAELKREPNPDRWFKNASGGTRALAFISMALSGIGNAMMGRGGKNEAIEIIGRRIDEDVKLQIAQKRDRVDALGVRRQGIASDKQDLRADLAEFDRMAAMEWKKYAMLTERVAATTKNEQVKGQALIASGQFNEKVRQHSISVAQREQQLAAQERASKRSAYVSRANARDARAEQARQFDARLGLDRDKFEAGKAAALVKSGPGGFDPADPHTIRVPVGKKGDVVMGRFKDPSNKPGNQKFREATSERMVVVEELNQFIDKVRGKSFAPGFVPELFAGAERKALEAEYNAFLSKYAKAVSGATVGDKEVERLQKTLPGLETWLTKDPSATYEQFRKGLVVRQKAENRIYLNEAPGFDVDKVMVPAESTKVARRSPQDNLAVARQSSAAPGLDPVSAKTRIDSLKEGLAGLPPEEASAEAERFIDDQRALLQRMMEEKAPAKDIAREHKVFTDALFAIGKPIRRGARSEFTKNPIKAWANRLKEAGSR